MNNWQKQVIGTVLVAPASYLEAAHLKASDFDASLQPIWKAITNLHRSGSLSANAVLETIRESNEVASLGEDLELTGEDFLLSLYGFADEDSLPLAVEKVLDAGIKKEMINYMPLVIAECRGGKPANTIIDETIDWLYNARRVKHEAVFIGELLPGFHEKMIKMREGQRTGQWHSRIEMVNDLAGYVADTEFIIVAGYGGGGKSSILRYEAIRTALDGETVYTFNGENDHEWYLRYGIAYLSTLDKDGNYDRRAVKLDTELLKRPEHMNDKHWERYLECKERLQSLPWIVDDMDTVSNMIFKAQQAHTKHTLALMQVDQIQNMTTTDFDKLETATYALRGMSKKLRVPLMAAHQLRKKGKEEGNREPKMDDLLYAGEHAAKQIWIMNRTQMSPGDARRFAENVDQRGILLPEDYWGTYVVRIKVAKNSSGRTGQTRDLAWFRGLNDFRPLNDDWRQQMKTYANVGITRTIKPYTKEQQLYEEAG